MFGPVRVAEDYASLGHLSEGRLELTVGKGNAPEQTELLGIGREQAWGTRRENDKLLRAPRSDEPVLRMPDTDVPGVRGSGDPRTRGILLPLSPPTSTQGLHSAV